MLQRKWLVAEHHRLRPLARLHQFGGHRGGVQCHPDHQRGGGQADWPWYWASTTHAASNGAGAAGVYLAFGRATGWQKGSPSATCYTLTDVHGAGAQRSDPKTIEGRVKMGTACNGGTAYGLGPQGDVQRGANFVRLVRSTNFFLVAADRTPQVVRSFTIPATVNGLTVPITSFVASDNDAVTGYLISQQNLPPPASTAWNATTPPSPSPVWPW